MLPGEVCWGEVERRGGEGRGGEARGGRGRGKTEWMGEDGMREVEAEGRRGGKGEEMG